MKKYIYSSIIISLFTLSLASCSLDKDPYSEITDKNNSGVDKDNTTGYTTAEALEGLLTDAYTNYADEFWQLDIYVMNDGQSDNGYAGESSAQTRQIDEFTMGANSGIAKRDWGYLYKQITKTNSILKWAPLVKDAALTESRRKEIIGEASFMRSLAYFNLVRIYGAVPLSIEEIPEITLNNIDSLRPIIFPKRVSADSIYTQVVIDMNVALSNAPDYSDNKFKITKPLANLVMAQIYATKDGHANTDWSAVKKYAETVVNDSRYSLLANYNDLFDVENASDNNNTVLPTGSLKNPDSKESLFEVHYTSWTTLGNWGAQMFYGIDWKKYNTPSKDLYNKFTSASDDVRRDGSIKFLNVTGKWSDLYWPASEFPFCYKLRAQEKADIILFRLPEAILLLAEAENELGNLAEAQKLLNVVRTRAKLENTTANTKDKLRLAIEDNHRFEFAFEGKRWFDLKRRGRFIEVMKSCSDHQATYAKNNLNENRLLWPIPQDEMDINTNLVQNPGY